MFEDYTNELSPSEQAQSESYREEKASGRISKRQQQILEVMRGSETNLSDQELLVEMCKYTGENLQINQVNTRRNELNKMGLIYMHGKRACTFTGKTVTTWKAKPL